ncbi:MAG: polysaccharide pyruvyl transferase family protein [Hyphomicrobiales bacterium]|nr:polysaccharide pyruvyl transferase family protein [Hyphomicrobiales bacterium]
MTDPTRADLIVIEGDGGMKERAAAIPRLVAHYAGAFPWTPLAMLPFTYDMRDNRLCQALSGRVAPVFLFCRDLYSFNMLRRERGLPPNCVVGLDHCTAFHLKSSSWVDDFRNVESRHVLVVDRLDAESRQTGPWRRLIHHGKAWFSPRLPKTVKKFSYPKVATLLGQMHSEYRESCIALMEQYTRAARAYPILAKDISLPNVCSFDDFCHIIAGSAAVFTTRLHVGVLSAMVGRPTFLFEGNNHKIRGIYEHSMVDWPHVRLVTTEEPIKLQSASSMKAGFSSKGA